MCLDQCLRNCCKLYALESPKYTESNLNAAWHEAKSWQQTDSRSRTTLFLLSAELFPGHASIHSPDMFKEIGHIDMELYKTIAWMLKQRNQTDIVVVSDGRSDSARSEIRKAYAAFEREVCEAVDFLELWIVYDDEPWLGRDPRNPKRKFQWSGNDVEVLFVALPSGIRGKRKVINRELSTNYSRSYTGVKTRALEGIPRLTTEDKARILGESAIGDCIFSQERVQRDVDSKGHPLFWCERKPISMYIALFGDFEVTDVIDLSIGSGAAAIGAQYKQCQYFGVCYNNNHMFWVRRLLRESFLNLVADGSINVDRAIVKNVKQYFQHNVLESRQWRPSQDMVAPQRYQNLVL